jgi:hypothetical protein
VGGPNLELEIWRKKICKKNNLEKSGLVLGWPKDLSQLICVAQNLFWNYNME